MWYCVFFSIRLFLFYFWLWLCVCLCSRRVAVVSLYYETSSCSSSIPWRVSTLHLNHNKQLKLWYHPTKQTPLYTTTTAAAATEREACQPNFFRERQWERESVTATTCLFDLVQQSKSSSRNNNNNILFKPITFNCTKSDTHANKNNNTTCVIFFPFCQANKLYRHRDKCCLVPFV